LSTPATAAGYQLLSGAQFDGVRASMQSQLPGDDLKSTVVAVYGSGTTPYAVIVAARPGKHANTAYQALVAGFEGDASAPVSSVAAGHLGGQMMCGAVTERGETAPTCAWGDKDTAVEFRNAIEH
jgi:hypothetical protein